jgi:hypothetical protein
MDYLLSNIRTLKTDNVGFSETAVVTSSALNMEAAHPLERVVLGPTGHAVTTFL